MSLIDVKDLHTYFYTDEGVVQAVDGISFAVEPGQTLGIVGESGCGKSVTALSIMQLIPSPPGRIVKGSILYGQNGEVVDLCNMKPKSREIRRIRGKEISMVFQDPMTSLNPVFTIGDQITETIMFHESLKKKEGREKAIEILEKVGFPHPAQRIDSYPHQLSGGLRQRAMIAMALSCNPKLLIADEPTTALDVTTQAQILELLRGLQEELHMAIIFITHDLGVINEMCDDVAVMYMGQIIEHAPVDEVFQSPSHPYTRALLNSMPMLSSTGEVKLNPIEGNVPLPINIKKGCRFLPRCREREDFCEREVDLPLIENEERHWVRCWLYEGKNG